MGLNSEILELRKSLEYLKGRLVAKNREIACFKREIDALTAPQVVQASPAE